MAANNIEAGRNLSSEMDEIKGRMNDMNETQARLEAILHDLRESLNLVMANKGSIGTEAHFGTQPITSTAMPIMIPVGEGYQPVETPHNETLGHAGPNLEQPHVSIPGQPVGVHPRSKQEFQKDKMNEESMEKMEEQIKAIKGPNPYGVLKIEDLYH